MAWLLVILVIVAAGVGGWALFRADDEAESGGALLGGSREKKQLPLPPPLPGYRPRSSWTEEPGPYATPGAETYTTPAQAGEPELVDHPFAAPSARASEPDFLAFFVPASIGKRFLARIVDGIITGIFTGFIGFAVSLAVLRRGNTGSATVVLVVSLLIFTAFYEIGFIAVLGQTPGKMFMGIRVVSALDGAVPTVAQAVVRWALPNLVGILPRLIGGSALVRAQLGGVAGLVTLLIYLWALWDPRKQGLHDKAAQTLVERFR